MLDEASTRSRPHVRAAPATCDLAPEPGEALTFESLGLSADLVQLAAEEGYETPTPVQEAAIPEVLAGRDVLAAAQTGTGKTAAFLLPILDRLRHHANTSFSPARHPVRVLILVPTRELAVQCDDFVRTYGRTVPLRAAVVYGGGPLHPPTKQLRPGVEVLPPPPGRPLAPNRPKAPTPDAARADARPRGLQGRHRSGPCRDRRRGPRARHRGPAACRELRAAVAAPRLRPSHRANRPSGGQRRRREPRVDRRGRPAPRRPAPAEEGHSVDRRARLRAGSECRGPAAPGRAAERRPSRDPSPPEPTSRPEPHLRGQEPVTIRRPAMPRPARSGARRGRSSRA